MHTLGRLAGVAVVALAMGACSNDTAPNGTVKETGGVWVANNSGTSISEFTVAQLDSSSAPTPAETIGGLEKTAGVAVDASGDVWVASYSLDTLWMYTLAQQTGGGAPTPTIKISSPSLSDPENIVFDSHGTLWVADDDNGLVGFTSSQLASSGTVTAAYTITNAAGNRGYWGIVFDKQGNGWASSQNGEIDEYTPTQLGASGPTTPTVALTTPVPSNNYSLWGTVFDGSGNMWAVFDTVLVQLPASSLAASGEVTPAVAITLPDSSDGFGIAIDKHGTVWVSDDNLNRMYGYTSSQLTTSGQPTPGVTLGGTGFDEPEQLTFDAMAPATTPSASRAVHPLGVARSNAERNPNRVPRGQ